MRLRRAQRNPLQATAEPALPGRQWRPPLGGDAAGGAGGEFVVAYAATNSFHFLTMYSFSSITAFQQAMPPMRAS